MENKTGTKRNSDEEIHHGENIRRLRLLFDIKQEAFAAKLGPGWVQKKVSILETKSAIDMRTIIQVAEVLEVSPAVISDCSKASFVAAMKLQLEKLIEKPLAVSIHNEEYIKSAPIVGALQDQNSLLKELIEIQKSNIARIEQLIMNEPTWLRRSSWKQWWSEALSRDGCFD